MSKLTKR